MKKIACARFLSPRRVGTYVESMYVRLYSTFLTFFELSFQAFLLSSFGVFKLVTFITLFEQKVRTQCSYARRNFIDYGKFFSLPLTCVFSLPLMKRRERQNDKITSAVFICNHSDRKKKKTFGFAVSIIFRSHLKASRYLHIRFYQNNSFTPLLVSTRPSCSNHLDLKTRKKRG